jgi:CHASE2 domain-containing sensor protein
MGTRAVKDASAIKKIFSQSALVGAALAALCGLLLWATPLGDPWINASYDFLFRFGARSVTNQVVLVVMDNDSYDQLHQQRGAIWDRQLHTRLLNKLTDDKAALVVFDIFFEDAHNAESDAALADAMRQNGKVVLAAEIEGQTSRQLNGFKIYPLLNIFTNAAAGWGFGKAEPETLGVARRHWPFYAPGESDIHSLGWVAARVLGAQFDTNAEKQWLRYYGKYGPGEKLPYYQALDKTPGYFRGKIVFIANWPNLPKDPGSPEEDKFRTPYTEQTGEAVGGVEIMATTFLNLWNGDWLRRPPAWSEMLLLTFAGILIGGGLCRLKPLLSLLAAAGIFLIVTWAFVSWSYFSNYWFPWLVIAGGQLPVALAWSWASQTRQVAFYFERFPGYTPVGEPFGSGSYGKVWLVRNAIGQLQALKEIERAKFDYDGPYDREFRGIQTYKPVSNEHPGLLHIDYVNRSEREGYFFYVLELGDALNPNWEQTGERYRPRDLASACEQAPGERLPVRECLRIGIVLLDALDFLHQRRFVHRDIKPANIIFVRGQPKLADVGLVRDINPEGTIVGTPEYMPPPPEPPGTKAADIYAMGKVLYVISSGMDVRLFPELSVELVENSEFMRLNEIICQACQPAADQRYASAAAMLAALRKVQAELDAGGTKII